MAPVITKSKLKLLFTVLFFAGIAGSVAALYAFSNQTITFTEVCTSTGITFLLGMIALYLTSSSVKQLVVYIEKKKELELTGSLNESTSQLKIAPFEQLMQNKKDLIQNVINELCRQLKAAQGAIYILQGGLLELRCGFALPFDRSSFSSFAVGEGLAGSVAKEGKSMYIDKVPHGLITVFSGLGSSSPSYLAVVPIKNNGDVKGVIEVALFTALNRNTIDDIELTGKILAENIL